MISRCFSVSVRSYQWYGGRGITVCDDWLTFSRFEDWANSNGYQIGLTVDRIDNDDNYRPENCQFLTKSDNVRKQFRQRERKIRTPLSEM